MGATIKKVTKKSWFYFLGAGGIAVAFFARMFLGGEGVISVSKLESDAKNAIMQTGVINVANADVGCEFGGSESCADGGGGDGCAGCGCGCVGGGM